MKEDVEMLLQEAEEIETKEFNNVEEARHYAHELQIELQQMENEIMEEKRRLDDMMVELRHKESKVIEYYLGVK